MMMTMMMIMAVAVAVMQWYLVSQMATYLCHYHIYYPSWILGTKTNFNSTSPVNLKLCLSISKIDRQFFLLYKINVCNLSLNILNHIEIIEFLVFYSRIFYFTTLEFSRLLITLSILMPGFNNNLQQILLVYLSSILIIIKFL